MISGTIAGEVQNIGTLGLSKIKFQIYSAQSKRIITLFLKQYKYLIDDKMIKKNIKVKSKQATGRGIVENFQVHLFKATSLSSTYDRHCHQMRQKQCTAATFATPGILRFHSHRKSLKSAKLGTKSQAF